MVMIAFVFVRYMCAQTMALSSLPKYDRAPLYQYNLDARVKACYGSTWFSPQEVGRIKLSSVVRVDIKK